MILVVTGSRFAKSDEHGSRIRHGLLWAAGARDGAFGDHELWDGSASGADGIAHDLAREDFGWKAKRLTASWSECDPTWVDPIGKAVPCAPGHRKVRSNGTTPYCPTAGFRRNALMISELVKVEGRKVVVGFPIPALGSRGTVDCLTRALHAGLPIVSVPLTSKDAL